MTSQDHATQALLIWQELRQEPDQQIKFLVSDFWLTEDERRFEQVLRNVQREMAS